MTVLDTDHLSVLERRDQPGSGALRARLAPLPPSDVVTTIISYEERRVIDDGRRRIRTTDVWLEHRFIGTGEG